MWSEINDRILPVIFELKIHIYLIHLCKYIHSIQTCSRRNPVVCFTLNVTHTAIRDNESTYIIIFNAIYLLYIRKR